MSNNLLIALVGEVATVSSLAPKHTNEILASLQTYYDSCIVAITDEYQEALAALYNQNDNERYSLVSIVTEDSREFVLIKYHDLFSKHIFKDMVEQFRSSKEFTGKELGQQAQALTNFRTACFEIFHSSVCTTRSATGTYGRGPDEEFPEEYELKAFYECGRKAAYTSKVEAETNLELGNVSYPCQHCSHYHQGHPSTNDQLSEALKLSRYKTAWLRYKRKRTSNHIADNISA